MSWLLYDIHMKWKVPYLLDMEEWPILYDRPEELSGKYTLRLDDEELDTQTFTQLSADTNSHEQMAHSVL